MKLSTEIANVARMFEEVRARVSEGPLLKVHLDLGSPNGLVEMLQRWSQEANQLEQRVEAPAGKSEDWMAMLVLKARLVLSSNTASESLKEFAEAVLVFAEREDPA